MNRQCSRVAFWKRHSRVEFLNFDENLIYRFANKTVVISIFSVCTFSAEFKNWTFIKVVSWPFCKFDTSAIVRLKWTHFHSYSLTPVHAMMMIMTTIHCHRRKKSVYVAHFQVGISILHFIFECLLVCTYSYAEWNPYGWCNLKQNVSACQQSCEFSFSFTWTNWTCLLFVRCNATGANKS